MCGLEHDGGGINDGYGCDVPGSGGDRRRARGRSASIWDVCISVNKCIVLVERKNERNIKRDWMYAGVWGKKE